MASGPNPCSRDRPRVLNLSGTRTNAFADQLAGKRLANQRNLQRRRPEAAARLGGVERLPTGSGVTPTASRSRNASIAESCWLDAAAGRRASGLVFAGDASGGLGIALRNFWQSFPASLEVRRCHDRCRGSACLAVVARCAPRWICATTTGQRRGARARSGFQLRRCAARIQHAARRRAHQRVDALSERRSVPSHEETAHQAELAQAPPLLMAAPEQSIPRASSASGACPTARREARRAHRRPARRGVRLCITKRWSSGIGTASGTTAT